ncbi:hypothetical protein DICPUDRAFT_95112 [Dictyostelium purpureum]|uniref:RNA helicase n=1 Tax=Dictyostelium purpureum TaxID=5786 RepID=F0ZSC7_DICPU|nr:uncharacterized protein DICPUDRAFT_95112 [Dictyostelium purpureum]EGC33158.1 hypothetical protein DICPUDRAFT_95112 [Dictyostelium purpureum]|eukprot:XP_003290314.1 hypothetical protein DICPUDRAFT_95112 [Dictyostelium purpureum]
MPIGNKNENDGSPLNEFSGLSISNEKGSSSSNSTTSEPYVPPSRRNKMSGNQGSRDNDNNSPYDSRQGENRFSNDSPFNRKAGFENRGNDGRRDSNNYNNNRDYKSPSFSRNNNWGDNNNTTNNREPPRGGNYTYSPNNSFNRQSGASGNTFGNRSSSFGKPANKNDRYYDRWNQFKDTRHFPDMKREIIDLEEDKVEEIFKTNGNVGIDFNSYDDDDISIETSEHICAPLISFTDVDLGDVILSNIKYAKYTKPTPVQKSALPIIFKNRDLMACAQTGSGKTAAFLLPIISGILLDGAPEPPASYKPGVPRAAAPRALVLAPTRELAQQIYNEANKFSYGSPIQSVVIYGGAEVFNQINELDKGVDILVATTGRLVDLLLRGRVTLSKIKYLVLDEADRMLDMGFEPQIRQIIGDFDMPGSRDRQTLMFSATFPKQIQALASDFLSNYIFLKVGVVGTTQNITQRIEYVSEEEKNSYLLDYISGLNIDGALTLIFVETKRSCDTLTFFLNNRGFPATCIHGDLTQSERENALHSFSSFQTPFLVATDIASRGLHIPNVMVVINYDLPTDVHIYVHRIGRTGRAGKKGLSISFFNEKNKPVGGELLKLLKASNQEIPDWFEKMVHQLRLVKGPSTQKSKYESPFNRSYNNHRDDRNDNRDVRDTRDNRSYSNNNNSSRGGNERGNEKSSNDYSMHHPYFNTGGSYN